MYLSNRIIYCACCNNMPKFPAIIFSVDWVIVAIGKEILIPVGFVGGSPKDIRGIRIDKPSPDRVIVPAAEVVQARFGVVDIPAVAQGICGAEGGGHGAAGIHKTGNVALGIFQVEIPVAVVRHRRGTQAVVGKVQLVAAPGHLRQLIAQVRVVVRCAVDCLGNALAVGIVAEGDAVAALAHRRQLAAVLPCIGPCAVGQGIAYGVVGDGLPIERRQQVRPIGVAVGIGATCCPDVAVF